MSVRLFSPKALFATFLLLTVALTGCDSGGANETGPVRTSLRFQATYAAPAAKTSGVIDIQEAKMLVRAIKFHGTEDSLDFKTGTLVVNLNPNDPSNTVVVEDIPEGTYKRITFDIHKPEDDETISDPEFKLGASGDQRFSVIVKGTMDGTAFDLRLKNSMKQRLDLVPPLVIAPGAGALNVTMQVDLNRWFVDEDGRALDPTNPSDFDDIEEAVKASFKAEKEEDD